MIINDDEKYCDAPSSANNKEFDSESSIREIKLQKESPADLESEKPPQNK
jgi:hypothetical protein